MFLMLRGVEDRSGSKIRFNEDQKGSQNGSQKLHRNISNKNLHKAKALCKNNIVNANKAKVLCHHRRTRPCAERKGMFTHNPHPTLRTRLHHRRTTAYNPAHNPRAQPLRTIPAYIVAQRSSA